MDGTDKINEMVGEVEDDGKTVLITDLSKPEVNPEQKAAPAEADPLNLASTEPAEKPAESDEKFDISLLMPEDKGAEPEHSESKVPVSEHIKLRKRAQAAEAKVAELEASRGKPEADNPYVDLNGIVDDPDDLVDGKTVAALVQQGVQRGIKQYHDALQTQSQATESKADQKKAYDESFDKARKQYADFDQVTIQAHKNGFLSDQELADVANSKNPAALLYAKSKERTAILGQPSSSVTGNNQPANELLDPAPVQDPDKEIGIYDVMAL